MTAVVTRSYPRSSQVDAVETPKIAPLAPVVGAAECAPLADGTTVRYANFDYAASAPALTAVADAVADALSTYASVHRGAGHLSQVTTRRYEECLSLIHI